MYTKCKVIGFGQLARMLHLRRFGQMCSEEVLNGCTILHFVRANVVMEEAGRIVVWYDDESKINWNLSWNRVKGA